MQTEHNGTPEVELDSTAFATALGAFSADHFIDEVPLEALELPWTYCAPWLERALEKTTDYDINDLHRQVEEGQAYLLIEWAEGRPQGCAVASIYKQVTGPAMHIMAVAGFPGKNFRYPNKLTFDLLAAKGRAWGCNCVQGFAIESAARLWAKIEFKEVGRLMRKSI
jgi:hypothetical protein